MTVKKITMSNTKKEILDSYEKLLKEYEEKEKSRLNPQKIVEEKKKEETIQQVDALSREEISAKINEVKTGIGKLLGNISNDMEANIDKYKQLQEAISIKQQQLKDIYGIEESAATLAILIESQKQKKIEYETEMNEEKKKIEDEIKKAEEDWEKEKLLHQTKMKEEKAAEELQRKRDKEDFEYNFAREKKQAIDKFNDEKQKMENELKAKKETVEKDLAEREKAVLTSENEIKELKKQVQELTVKLEAEVKKAIAETTNKMKMEFDFKYKLIEQQYDGEKNVFKTQIASLENKVKEQTQQVDSLSRKAENAYEKVQSVAEKAIEGASSQRALLNMQKNRQDQEKTGKSE